MYVSYDNLSKNNKNNMNQAKNLKMLAHPHKINESCKNKNQPETSNKYYTSYDVQGANIIHSSEAYSKPKINTQYTKQ